MQDINCGFRGSSPRIKYDLVSCSLHGSNVVCCAQAKYPCVLEGFASFAALANAKRVAVFLDYDGTLTPIVKNPDRAYMSDQV